MKFNKLFKSLAVTLAVFGTGAILASCGTAQAQRIQIRSN
ncbi:hypothetical protein AKUH3B206M_14310 [Apilactobacillus kunkeei]|nr:hypothetical protein AKUH3B206M_14310 [Apilactobacillus kunkeei]